MSITCPYPGLRAFFTEERDWYFGREAHVDAMLTCLESSRVLAVVGSSGSGKSSLVYAGLLPALREGQLAGSRRDEQGQPAPWRFVDFKPGNDPLENLATAIVAASPRTGDPHLGGYVRAALRGGESGLVAALDAAGLLDEQSEILVYADQFEELFRFGEKSGRAEQEDALRFARLFVAAATQTAVRLHLLLSMRSEFIGECERFPGLPELVSRSQFLTPRLSRRQLEFSLRGPAEAVGWKLAPDALAAILNDCADRPDHLPLAQHILRRMWHRAEAAGRTELTLEDYQQRGGITGALAQHGHEILYRLLGVDAATLDQFLAAQRDAPTHRSPKPVPPLLEVARIFFMALCDQREEGPLVRRLSTREEIAAIAGAHGSLVPRIAEAFGGDDPGFIREEGGWLDVRHEVVLRQWPLIADWRTREADSEAWLRDLANDARDRERNPRDTALWHGANLRGARRWMLREQPGELWAKRHGIDLWAQCLEFLKRSRRSFLLKSAMIASCVCGLLCWAMVLAIQMSFSERHRRMAEFERRRQQELSFEFAEAFAKDVEIIAEATLARANSAISDAQGQADGLLALVRKAGNDDPPEPTTSLNLTDSRRKAEEAIRAWEAVVRSIAGAARATNADKLAKRAAQLTQDAVELRPRFNKVLNRDAVVEAVDGAVNTRIERAAAALAKADAGRALSPAERRKAIIESTDIAATELNAIKALEDAADALGLDDIGDSRREVIMDLENRLADVRATVDRTSTVSALPAWRPEPSWQPEHGFPPLAHGGRVNRIRFSPHPDDGPGLASACEDRYVWFWYHDGRSRGRFGGSSPVNDVAFKPKPADAPSAASGKILATASAGSTVRLLVLGDPVKAKAFERHSDSITDVEFSRGGDYVVSASADRTVRVFDSGSLAQLYFSSPPLPGIVTSAVFHRGGNLVVSGCDDGGVRLHTLVKPAIRLMGKFDAPARRPEFSPDGAVVLAASGDKTARLWSIERPGELANILHEAPLTHATFRPIEEADMRTFVTTATNGAVRLVRVDNAFKSTMADLEPRHPGAAVFATWSADGRWLATVGGGEVLLWEWSVEKLNARLRIEKLHPATSRAEFSPDAKLLVTYGGDHLAFVWDLTQVPPAVP